MTGRIARWRMSRDFLAFLLAFVYMIGFLVFSITTWVDFTDRFAWAESFIAYGSVAILDTVYAPVTFSPLYDTPWLLLWCYGVGYTLVWIWLYIRERIRSRAKAGI
jgi:hypothetical protein